MNKEQLSRDTERAYYWLAKNHPPNTVVSVRGRALDTLRLRILKQSSFDEIAGELGGSIGEHSARCAWAREMHKREKRRKRKAHLEKLTCASLERPHISRLQSRAHATVAKAIECGELLAPHWHTCAHCDKRNAQEYHHDDYTCPLDVTPLCKSCHRQHHAKLRKKK